MRLARLIPTVVCVSLALFFPAAQGAYTERTGVPLWVEPSSTWVGLAKVHLELSDLRWSGHEIAGRYAIRVPLMPSQDDTGTIRLMAASSLDRLREVGGTLSGIADSVYHDRPQGIDCSVESDGTLAITVTTAERTLRFSSRFVEPPPSS